MVQCAECGTELLKIPRWLADVKVAFICDACRQKHPRHWISPELEPIIMVSDEEVAPEEEMEIPFSQLDKKVVESEEVEFGYYEIEEEQE